LVVETQHKERKINLPYKSHLCRVIEEFVPGAAIWHAVQESEENTKIYPSKLEF
jgi:hypothetical protein